MKTMVRTGKMRNMTASALVVSLGLFFLAASTPAEDLQEIIVITGQRIAGNECQLFTDFGNFDCDEGPGVDDSVLGVRRWPFSLDYDNWQQRDADGKALITFRSNAHKVGHCGGGTTHQYATVTVTPEDGITIVSTWNNPDNGLSSPWRVSTVDPFELWAAAPRTVILSRPGTVIDGPDAGVLSGSPVGDNTDADGDGVAILGRWMTSNTDAAGLPFPGNMPFNYHFAGRSRGGLVVPPGVNGAAASVGAPGGWCAPSGAPEGFFHSLGYFDIGVDDYDSGQSRGLHILSTIDPMIEDYWPDISAGVQKLYDPYALITGPDVITILQGIGCIDCQTIADGALSAACDAMAACKNPSSVAGFTLGVTGIAAAAVDNAIVCDGSFAPEASCLDFILNQVPGLLSP